MVFFARPSKGMLVAMFLYAVYILAVYYIAKNYIKSANFIIGALIVLGIVSVVASTYLYIKGSRKNK
jgi:ABC-type transport system involved in cytochrome c biogenesis permease subunit